MISKKLINALLSAATKERKDVVIKELFNHISLNYDYNDTKASHIIEMLVDDSAVVYVTNVNLDYVKKNPKLLMYNHEKYNIRNIKAVDIDNIDCTVKFQYEYLEKINEDRDDVSYKTTTSMISFNDYPDILK